MTTRAFAPAVRTISSARLVTDTRLASESTAHSENSRATLRVLIATHQPIVRRGLRDVIASESDLQVVGEADEGLEAVRLARQLRPDVVLIDLSIPSMDAISATRMIRAELRDTQVVVMTGVDTDTAAIEAIRAGAAAYLLKDVRIEELLRTIRGAGAGQIALPARAMARMIRPLGGHEILSHRETEVLRLVARGLANKQIARELGISLSTVKTHVNAILSKLGLPSRTQAAMYAARTGLVALDLQSNATFA
jgi:DNA-binding NarL/FixJ family response regulator